MDAYPGQLDEHPTKVDEDATKMHSPQISSDAYPLSADEHPLSSDAYPLSSDAYPLSSDAHPLSSDKDATKVAGYAFWWEKKPSKVESYQPVILSCALPNVRPLLHNDALMLNLAGGQTPSGLRPSPPPRGEDPPD